MGLRLNFGFGPLRYFAPLFKNKRSSKLPPQHGKALGVFLVVGTLLCCCGVGINGALSDNDEPKSKVPAFVKPSPSHTQTCWGDCGEDDDATPTPISASPTPRKTTTSPVPKRSTASTKPRTTTKKPTPTTDKRYDTCKEANAHGLGPYYKGIDPEYYWYIDRDGDGKVCERR